jgi:protein-S-isoprenylcysteine O-methyltransferase Ste14
MEQQQVQQVQQVQVQERRKKKKKKKENSQVNKLVSVIIAVGLFAGWYFSTSLKYQWVRVIDVLIIGPLSIWASTKIRKPLLAKIMMAFFGSALITFNLKNYVSAGSSGCGWM